MARSSCAAFSALASRFFSRCSIFVLMVSIFGLEFGEANNDGKLGCDRARTLLRASLLLLELQAPHAN